MAGSISFQTKQRYEPDIHKLFQNNRVRFVVTLMHHAVSCIAIVVPFTEKRLQLKLMRLAFPFFGNIRDF